MFACVCPGGFEKGLFATKGDGWRLGAGDAAGVPTRDVCPDAAANGFPAEDGLLPTAGVAPKGLLVAGTPKGLAVAAAAKGFDVAAAGAPKVVCDGVPNGWLKEAC